MASEPSSVDVMELEALRTPLTRYCYRLLGSAADADDAVQEALIRAARSEAFDASRGRLGPWVYRIATNVCLDMLRSARRRALVMDVTAEGGELGAPLPPERWVEPMPDRRLFAASDPGDLVQERESVRLAFVALLQRLSPRQRAAVLLRDVLGFSARDTARVLDSTVAATNSALQRGRAILSADRSMPPEPVDPNSGEQRRLLRRYIAAFESHDVAGLTALLRADAIASMPPFDWAVRGAERIAALMGDSDACAHDRLLPTAVNGAPGLGQYRPDAAGRLRPFAIIALEPRGGRIQHIVTFLGTAPRFAEFGLPDEPGR